MRFPVPQFINIEDRVAGPLTWKQLYWMMSMGALLLLLWKALSGIYFIIIGLPIAVVFTAMAFWKPWGQPLSRVLWHFMIFVFRPKSYFWQRISERDVAVVVPSSQKTKQAPIRPYKETLSQIQNFADMLDNPENISINEKEGDFESGKKSMFRSLFSKKKY